MKFNFARRSFAACAMLGTVVCHGADAPPPPEGVWTGKGQAGFLSSHGNSEAKSFNAALDLERYDGPWKHALDLAGLYGSSAGIVSAERWQARWQSNYDLTSTLFTFGALRYDHDMFSGFQYQASATGGLGYKILNSNDTKLTAQAGVGYRRLRPEELVKDDRGAVVQRLPGDSNGGAIFTAGLDYSQVLTSSTTLTNKALLEAGSGNTLITNTLALAVKMSDKLAVSLGYGLTDNTKPPPGLKKLDTVMTVNLVYAF
ncbi:MAG: DUF481 domain-containing protein [Proteobacteria bacterium]|nr:DUF481 domain-containing protein [Pseudomonadota bacterium]MBS0421651.1 DUF481 domain-containing protein [Pseudomonadota bacterium]